MGEENTSGGTARYVDSSLERIEVRVSGWNDSRYVITVNGRALPLHSTGTVGEYVAGVRFKAWNPPSSLHPTMACTRRWCSTSSTTGPSARSWLPVPCRASGRSQLFDGFPVNAYEAESRRLARFFQMGHTPGRLQVEPARSGSREFPFTLDLRH